MKISFVIPTYNSSIYIGRCLDSIFSQKLSLDDYEVIVIDDGSSDNTIDVLECYKKKFGNFRYFKQENSGPGIARNYGLKVAKGTYVQFVDSDDYLKVVDFKYIINLIKSNNLDILFFNSYIENEEVTILQYQSNTENKEPMSGLEYISLNRFICSPVMHISKREFLIEKNLFYPQRRGAEDIDYTIKMICEAKRVMYMEIPLYVICEREGSLSRKPSINFQYSLLESIYQSIIYINSSVKIKSINAYKVLSSYCLNLFRMHNNSIYYFKSNEIHELYKNTQLVNKEIFKGIRNGVKIDKYLILLFLRSYFINITWLLSILTKQLKIKQ